MIESVILAVTDMKCGGCEANITGKLEAINGVISVKASFKDKEVSVEYDTEKTSPDTIKNAITGAGFTVK
jgi:copper chaperone